MILDPSVLSPLSDPHSGFRSYERINQTMDIQEHLKTAKRSGELEFFIEKRQDDFVISRMPVGKGALNPFGTVQAGAMLWLADVTATVLAIGNAELGESGQGFPLAINLNANLLSNQRGGEILAEARFVRKGKRITVVRTCVTGDDGKLLAEVTTTHVPAI
jgi:uncharacterized protein (TIGR00369 family)